MPVQPIDPLTGPKYALEGKVVTMNDALKVHTKGAVYIDAGRIVAVQARSRPKPSGFSDAPFIRTGGTIYPGLIELHNHLSYNILPMWDVPRQFTRREQWRNHADKRKLITGPMKVLGKTPGIVEAIVRYVEAKCLVSGVTTSQGLKLYGVGIQRYYHGVTRNVEETNDPELPEARTRIPDVEAEDAEKFLERLKSNKRLLLHLSEGIDERSREHFEALQLPNGEWAITEALAGIHCAALTPSNFDVMHQHKGSMIWSPLSNMLLYGKSADIRAAKEAEMLIGIGSDWSPSGSKNLLCELKVAHLVNESLGGIFSSAEIVAMATSNAAKILNWEKALGSIEPGKRADLLVIHGRQGDPYQRLLNARESSITLVVINGFPRIGQKRLMKRFKGETEQIKVGSAERVLNLKQETANPIVGELTLREAADRIQDGFDRLPELARDMEDPNNAIAKLAEIREIFDDPDLAMAALVDEGITLEDPLRGASGIVRDLFEKPIFFLELDQDELVTESLRHHLPRRTAEDPEGIPSPLEAAIIYSELLKDVQITLDPLTVVDDNQYFVNLAQQLNLDKFIKAELPPLYGAEPQFADDASFLRKLHPAVKPQFANAMALSSFLRSSGYLSLEDRRRIVEQALMLLERIYVHMPLKRSMHAINPIQRLKLLQYHLDETTEALMPDEMDFHNELTSIFASTRDLHTNYLLPKPYRDMTAFLPFFIEEYFEGDESRYIISKVIGDVGPESFQEDVEVLTWNGMPIRKAIELNADRQAGSNAAARHARGLDTLTIRPMIRVLPPEEEWVLLQYRTPDGEEGEIRQKWMAFSPDPSISGVDANASILEATALGIDLQTDAVHHVKKVFYAADAVDKERDIAEGKVKQGAPKDGMQTSMPTIFRARPISNQHGEFGVIRIFSFNVSDADDFVKEFVRLAESMPENGLIIDVRGNGGGLIYAAERLLQVLTPVTSLHPIEPQKAQFINTPLTLQICIRHAPSKLWSDFDLGPWVDSIGQAVEIGTTYSRGFPITPPDTCNSIGQKYFGPVVLITDALCYSATDIFAAGFKDHKIGKILGVNKNTGAGGANVWSHELLQILMDDPVGADENSPFQSLPHGAGMRVAVRRTLRVGEQAGIPVEDLGVLPDVEYRMTKDDLLYGNKGLIEKASEILAEGKPHLIEIRNVVPDGSNLSLTLRMKNITRLDVFIDQRPVQTFDVSDQTEDISFQLPQLSEARPMSLLELHGYEADRLVAAPRLSIL